MPFRYHSLADRVDPKRLTHYRVRLEMIFRGLDIFLQLPSHGRRRVESNDPEHVWGGGISSPTEERRSTDFEARRIVSILAISLAAAYLLIRLILPFL